MAADEAPSTGVSKWHIGLAVAGATAAAAAGYLFYRSKTGESGKESSEAGVSTSTGSADPKASASSGKGPSSSSTSDQSSASQPQERVKLTGEELLERALKCKNQGNKHFKDSEYEAAIQSYEKALEICPESYTTERAAFNQNIAACFEQLGMRATDTEQKAQHLRTVIDRCTTALKLNKRYTKAFVRRARGYQLCGDLEKSLDDVTAASILENMSGQFPGNGPPSSMAQNIMALANIILKDLGKAKAADYYSKRQLRPPSASYLKSYIDSYHFDMIRFYDCEDAASESVATTVEAEKEPLSEEAASSGAGELAEGSSEAEASSSAVEEETPAAKESTEIKEAEATPNSEETEEKAAEENKTKEEDKQGDEAEAVETTDSAVTQEPFEDKHAKYRRAVELFRDAKYEESRAACLDALDGDVTSKQRAHLFLLLGTLHQMYHRIADAMEALNKVIATPAEECALEVRVNGLVKRGSQQLIAGKPDEALADFQTAHGLNPTNPDVFHHRGQMHFLLDRLPEAIADYQQCALLQPSFCPAQVQLQYAKYKLAAMSNSEMLVQEVITAFEDILKHNPEYVEGISLYAQVLQDQGKLERAEELYKSALALQPENGVLYVHQGLLYLQKSEDIERALAEMKKALAVDSECDFAYETMATLEVQRGHVSEAIALWDKAIDICRTEIEMAHLFSLREAAEAQGRVTQQLGLPMPNMGMGVF